MEQAAIAERPATTGNSSIVIDGSRAAWVNIATNRDHYEIVTHLGVANEDDLAVGITDHVLTIAAKHCSETCREVGGFLLVDHRDNAIEQSFALPVDANEDDLTLNLDMGVLKVVIGRRQGFGQPVDLSAWRVPRVVC